MIHRGNRNNQNGLSKNLIAQSMGLSPDILDYYKRKHKMGMSRDSQSEEEVKLSDKSVGKGRIKSKNHLV